MKARSTEGGSGSAADVVAVTLKTTTDERQVRGGVLRGNSLRLLGVDEIDIEVPLGGNLIYMRNRDVPGVIGKIGTLLGRHNVNIGNFALGRREPKMAQEAMAVVQVDSPARGSRIAGDQTAAGRDPGSTGNQAIDCQNCQNRVIAKILKPQSNRKLWQSILSLFQKSDCDDWNR